MNTIYEHFSFPPDQSFTIRVDLLELKKYRSFRKHSNFEIAFIENCAGKRLIGASSEIFQGSDLVLMAGNIPHCWQYEEESVDEQEARVIVVHFLPDLFGRLFWEIPEAKSIAKLFENAKRGIVFYGEIKHKVRRLLQQMLAEKEMERVITLLQLMDLLSKSSTYRILNEVYVDNTQGNAESGKMACVHRYLLDNFGRQVTLEEVAAIIPMTPTSFCRYFKQKTGKTFSRFLKEIRINYAARLLLGGDCSVSEARYRSGYNNISNFNKHFKQIKGVAPKLFKTQYVA